MELLTHPDSPSTMADRLADWTEFLSRDPLAHLVQCPVSRPDPFYYFTIYALGGRLALAYDIIDG